MNNKRNVVKRMLNQSTRYGKRTVYDQDIYNY